MGYGLVRENRFSEFRPNPDVWHFEGYVVDLIVVVVGVGCVIGELFQRGDHAVRFSRLVLSFGTVHLV